MSPDQIFTLYMTLLVGGLTILGAIAGSLLGVFIDPYFRYVEEMENFEKYILYPFVSASAEACDSLEVYFGKDMNEQEINRNNISLSVDRLSEKTSILHNSGLFIQLIDRGENGIYLGNVAGLEFHLRSHREYKGSPIEIYSDYLHIIEKALNECGKNQDKLNYKPTGFCPFSCKRVKMFFRCK